MNDFDLDIVLFHLLEDEFEEDVIKKRNGTRQLFKKRRTEGAFQLLICQHLIDDDTKFREYFRLTPNLFDYVLQHIKDDIMYLVLNRKQEPITPKEKLCITLR